MEVSPLARAVAVLRERGASFAFLHGSRASGTARPDSDIDVAAWWAADPPPEFEMELPSEVDLLVLTAAPLELAGRVAVSGQLLSRRTLRSGCAGSPPPAKSTSMSCRD